MRPVVTDRVAWSVTVASPTNTAEPIEMLFGLRTRAGPGNHILDGDADPPWEGAILANRAPIAKYRDILV